MKHSNTLFRDPKEPGEEEETPKGNEGGNDQEGGEEESTGTEGEGEG